MKLSKVARLMYDLQEYCISKKHQCSQCKYWDGQMGRCVIKQMLRDSGNRTYIIPPRDWNITKADIERLESDEDGTDKR